MEKTCEVCGKDMKQYGNKEKKFGVCYECRRMSFGFSDSLEQRRPRHTEEKDRSAEPSEDVLMRPNEDDYSDNYNAMRMRHDLLDPRE